MMMLVLTDIWCLNAYVLNGLKVEVVLVKNVHYVWNAIESERLRACAACLSEIAG
jgi:hypothetical protein